MTYGHLDVQLDGGASLNEHDGRDERSHRRATLLLKDSWLSNIFPLPMIMIVLTKKKLVLNSIII